VTEAWKGRIFTFADPRNGKVFYVGSVDSGEPSPEEQWLRMKALTPPGILPDRVVYQELVEFASHEERQKSLWSFMKMYPDLLNDRIGKEVNRKEVLLMILGRRNPCTMSDKQLAAASGLSRSQTQRYLKKFQEGGIISVRRKRYFLGQGWANDRTIIVNEDQDAISEAKVSKQRHVRKRSAAAEESSQHPEDLRGHGGGDSGTGRDAGAHRETGSGTAANGHEGRGNGIQAPWVQ